MRNMNAHLNRGNVEWWMLTMRPRISHIRVLWIYETRYTSLKREQWVQQRQCDVQIGRCCARSASHFVWLVECEWVSKPTKELLKIDLWYLWHSTHCVNLLPCGPIRRSLHMHSGAKRENIPSLSAFYIDSSSTSLTREPWPRHCTFPSIFIGTWLTTEGSKLTKSNSIWFEFSGKSAHRTFSGNKRWRQIILLRCLIISAFAEQIIILNAFKISH